MSRNVGFDMPMPKARGSRQAQIQKSEGVDVGNAVAYLEEAEAGSIALTEAVKEFAIAARSLLEGGLTENAIVLLVQDLAPKAHGRPIPKDTILAVLKAAGRLKEHVR